MSNDESRQTGLSESAGLRVLVLHTQVGFEVTVSQSNTYELLTAANSEELLCKRFEENLFKRKTFAHLLD